jgi:hypothetical protein
MTGMLVLACFVTGFIVAWLLRTGYVMAQITWVQEQGPLLARRGDTRQVRGRESAQAA